MDATGDDGTLWLRCLIVFLLGSAFLAVLVGSAFGCTVWLGKDFAYRPRSFSWRSLLILTGYRLPLPLRALLVLAGTAALAIVFHAMRNTAEARFARITHGMTEVEVTALLGPGGAKGPAMIIGSSYSFSTEKTWDIDGDLISVELDGQDIVRSKSLRKGAGTPWYRRIRTWLGL